MSLRAVKSVGVLALATPKAPRNPMPCRWEMLDNVFPFQWGFVQLDHFTEPASDHKKRENGHKQEGRKVWWAGKEEPTTNPTCQHQV